MKNLFIALAMLFAPLLHGAVQPSIGGTELMKANGGRGTNTALFGATTNNGPLNLASGATNFGAAPIRSAAFNLDGTNLPVQIDAQIDAKAGPLLQSATNYANSVTNASIMRQTQATTLSNVVVALAYSLGTDATNFTLLASNAVRLAAGLASTNHAEAILQSATNYANATTNSSIVRQTQLTAMSNDLVALAYTIGANGTNYTLTASNNVRLVAGLAATNHAAAILQSATNYADSLGSGGIATNANQFGESTTLTIKDGALLTNVTVRGLTLPTLTADRPAIINGSGNLTNATGTPDGTKFLRDDGTLAVPPGGVSGIATNANQFGASTTLTIKSGALLTNTVFFGQTNAGPVDFSHGATNYSTTAPIQSVPGFTSGSGTEYGEVGYLDPSTGALLVETWTNITQNVTNIYNSPWPTGLGWCYQVASSNAVGAGFVVHYTNGPCGAPATAQTPWLSDINSAGFNLTNVDTGIRIGRLDQPVTNSSTEEVYGFGIKPFDAASLTNATALFGVGNRPLANSKVTDSLNVYAYGADALENITVTNSYQVFGYGKSVLGDSVMSDVGDIYAYGYEVLDEAFITNTFHVYGYGRTALADAIVIDSSEVYAFGHDVLNEARIKNGTGGIYGYGNSSFEDAIIDSSFYIFSFGHDSLRASGMTNSSEVYAFGESALWGAMLADSTAVYAFGKRAGQNLSGIFTDVYMFGTDSIVDTNSQMDFGGGDMRYRFRGTNGFRVESFTVNFTNIPGSGSFMAMDADGFLFRTNNPASTNAESINNYYNTNIFNNWTIFQSNVVFNNRVTFNSTVTFATNTFFSQIIATNAAFTVNTNLGAGGALTNFTVNLDGDNNLFIDGGTTNVNLRAMNWAAGLAKTVNLVITNRTATVRTISFDGITNNWFGMGTITGPIQLTNGLYLSIKSMGGSNMWYGAQYTALPTQ